MIIKKVGEVLLVRLKLFKIIAKITPLMMIFSLLLVYFSLDLKQEYLFQEPSLRTKLQDVKTHKPDLVLKYTPITKGVEYIKIEGAMNNQCILLTFPKKYSQYPQVKNIYQTLLKSRFNPKNTILLSYQSSTHLKQFFDWYYNPSANTAQTFGIIRIGLNFQIQYQKNTSLNSDKKQVKNKAFLDIYSPSLHTDLDYYQALKELLELTVFSYLPCEKVLKQPFKTIRNGFVRLGNLLDVKHETKGLADNLVCDFSNHVIHHVTAHQVMMLNGFQAGTVKFVVAANSQKPEQIIVSFVKEFSLQEEHLHSARVFFYPMSRTEQLQLGAFVRSGILFTLMVIIFLIDQFIKSYDKNILNYPLSLVAVLLVWTIEYDLTNNNTYSLLFSFFLFMSSVAREGYQMLKSKTIFTYMPPTYLEYLIPAISALISLYFGLFCFPLSILTIMSTCLMLAKPQKLFLRVIFKVAVLILLSYCMLQIMQTSIPIREATKTIEAFSSHLNSIFILFFLELSL